MSKIENMNNPLMWRRCGVCRAGLATLIASVFWSGCAGPAYRVPTMEVPTAWQADLSEVEPVEDAWWRVFNDDTLTALLADVRRENRDLATAIARLEAHASAYHIARADFFPMLHAQASAKRSRQSVPAPDTSWRYQTALMVSWEWDVWGRVRRNMQAAQGDWEAAREDQRHLLVMLQAQTAVEYVLLRTAQQRLAYAETNVELQRDTLALVRNRFEAGLTGELDVRQAEMNLAATRAQVPALQSAIAQTLNALCLLTGRYPGALDHLLDTDDLPQASAIPDALPVALMRARPDIRAAERQLAAQTARIGVAQAAAFPSFHLDGTLGWGATELDDLFQSSTQHYEVGPAVQWALFTGGKIRQHVRAERAATDAALAHYEQTVLNAYREAEDALVAHQREQEQFAYLHEAVTAASQSVELVNTLYRSGLVNFQSVLDMQRQLATYQDQLAQSQGQLAAGLVGVYKAFGAGWQDVR